MPVTQSSKPSQTATPVQLLLSDFSGGLNADMANHPLALAENELADILNFKYVKTPKGVKLKMRDGLIKYSSAGAFPGAIKDIFLYTTSAGNSFYAVVADSDLNYWTVGGAGYTKIGDLSSTRGRMCQFNDKLIIADTGTLKYWNGTTFAILKDTSEYLIDNIDETVSVAASYALYNGAKTRIAQKVTLSTWGAAAQTLAITSIEFKLKKTGSPTGTAVAKLYASDGTTLLATGTTINATDLTTSFAIYSSSITYSLVPNTEYYFALEYTGGDASNTVDVYSGEFPTAGQISGVAYYYSSSTWTSFGATYDVAIRITPNYAPWGSFVVQKQDRIYCNHVTYPNRLYYCNANDPNDWSSEDGGGYIIFDGHYQINGLAVWYDEIYVFCDLPKAVYRMTGDSPNEYVVKKLFSDVTVVSQDAIQNVGIDLLFLDQRAGLISLKTMISYGDIEKSIVSKKVQNTYIMPYYATQVSGKHEHDNQYLLTTTGQNVLVYDVELGIWTIYEFELGTSITPTAFYFGGTVGVLFVGASDGHLYYMDYAAEQDNVTDFNLVAKTGWHDFGTIQVKTARFADSLLISANQETYDLEIYTDFNENTVKKTLSMVSLSKNGAYHSPYCGNINEVSMRFNQIQAKLTNISSGTGLHWLDRIVIDGNIMSSYT